MEGSAKGCERRLGALVNKIETINPKISLKNYIDTPPNPTSNNMVAIAYSGVNIHLSKKSTPTMAPIIMENAMKSRLPDISTMKFSHISTLQIPGLSKQAR